MSDEIGNTHQTAINMTERNVSGHVDCERLADPHAGVGIPDAAISACVLH